MSIPFFLPPPTYLPHLSVKKPLTLTALCKLAGVPCRASGAWIEREVEIVSGRELSIVAEPGDWGRVRIVMPASDRTYTARFALVVMAFALHDLVARESIKGAPWAAVTPPRGRRKTGRALTVRERQQRFRQNHLEV